MKVSETTGDKESYIPTLKEVENYCLELESNVNPEKFFNYYTGNSWTLGGRPINDWKALFRSWDKNEKKQPPKTEMAQTTRRKMATTDDPEFAAYVMEFTYGK